MRTWGRVTNPDGTKTWQLVQTDANGFDDAVWITTLVQNLKLNLAESPFYSNNGIPAHQSIVQQIAPDFAVNSIQQEFSQYFASLIIAKQNTTTPTYNISIVTNYGAKLQLTIPV